MSGAEPLNGEIVPFGKYNGRPVSELEQDGSYRDWVLSQPWVEQRYPQFYTFPVNGGPPPEDSPEHNEMQAQFLDDAACLALARLIPETGSDYGFEVAFRELQRRMPSDSTPKTGKIGHSKPTASDIKFENKGWDVIFRYRPRAIFWRCTCDLAIPAEPEYPSAADYGADHAQAYQLYRDQQQVRKEASEHHALHHHDRDCSYARKITRPHDYYGDENCDCNGWARGFSAAACTVAAELKPDLGDDFPVVLRQVQKRLIQRERLGFDGARDVWSDRPTCDVAFVVVRRARFRSVTWEQVQRMFHASDARIHLVRESDLRAAHP